MCGETIARIQMDLYKQARNDRNKKFKNLMRLLLDDAILSAAWDDVCKGTKSSGIDSLSVANIKASGVEDFLGAVKKELKDGEYRADKVLFFDIPKSNGQKRQLGILTVKDRLLQAAMKLILEPIFEAEFDSCSFGFRVYRSPKLASLEVYKWLEAGNNHVLKGDITDCFNNIPHDRLMNCLKNRIQDEAIISIIHSWLKAGSAGKNSFMFKEKGIMQGGIISPLLMNIYLDQFDNEWEDIGLKSLHSDSNGYLVRFADDFVILSRDIVDKKHVSDILNRIELELNEEKTILTSSKEGFEFLGFYFVETFPENKYKGNVNIYPADSSIKRTIESITEITQIIPDNRIPPEKAIQRMNVLIDTWLNYYHHTEYAEGMERIQRCYNERLQVYMNAYSSYT